jgi:predicted Zn-dependent peptidase
VTWAAAGALLAALAGGGVAQVPVGPGSSVDAAKPTLPQVTKYRLSNGLPVWIAEYHDLAVVQSSLVVLSGTGDDPPGRYGIASLTAQVLTEGAGLRSARELADAIDTVGANLSASATADASILRLHVPAVGLSQALPLMADVAQRPAFEKEGVDRVRQQRLTTLRQAREDADAIASLAFTRAIYGSAHRYATALVGTATAIEAFTPDDLRAFHTSVYRPDNSGLIVVGDVEAETVLPLLESSFGTWRPAGAKSSVEPLPNAPPPTRQLVLVDKPDAPQSQIRIGGVAAARSTPDFYAIQVMSGVLGGRLNTRINVNLREGRGSTSSARVGFDMRRTPGPFVITAAVQTDRTADSVTELLAELSDMLKEIPAGELTGVKNDLAYRFPPTYETTGRISSRLESLEPLVVYGLSEEYYSSSAQAILAVTPADVARVAREYLLPDRLTVVVVGDRDTVEPQLRRLDLGPVREMAIAQVFE